MLALTVGAETANAVMMLRYTVTQSQLCICTDVCAALYIDAEMQSCFHMCFTQRSLQTEQVLDALGVFI